MNVNDGLQRTLSVPTQEDLIIQRPYTLEGESPEGYAIGLVSPVFGLASVLHAARACRDNAVSYRDFPVGAAALAYDSSRNRIGILAGANVKVDSTDLVNIHAEDVVLDKVRNFGGRIVLMAIVGEPQEDHVSGFASCTLQPCGKCRPKLSEFPGVTDETVYVSATPDLSRVQVYTHAALLAFHETGDESGIRTFELKSGEADWHTTVGPYLTEMSWNRLRANAQA